MKPKDMEITCTSGSGAMLDYLLVSPQAQHLVAGFSQLETAPWRPHSGFHPALHGRPPGLLVRQAIVVKELTIPKVPVDVPIGGNGKKKGPADNRGNFMPCIYFARTGDCPIGADKCK